MDAVFSWMLIFVPLAGLADFLSASPVVVFFLSALAIVPLAKFIGQATEELAARTSTAFGGFLNVTFGNITELIIGIFALHAGLINVVKASITGSIIGNLLLVSGTAITLGGFRFKKQTFNKTAALASGSTLLLAITALIMPTILPITAPGTSAGSVEFFSLLVAFCMIAMYGANLIFSLYTHAHLYSAEAGEAEGGWSTQKSVLVLVFSTLAVAWMSNVLVGSINPIAQALGWTPLFIGVVIVAIVGNVAEHASAVTMALKNKMELALQIAIGSATQIVMFVTPVLVFISLFFASKMNLVFDTFELAAMILSILIVNIVIEDGESNWLEGVQLLIAYLIMAIAFFVHP